MLRFQETFPPLISLIKWSWSTIKDVIEESITKTLNDANWKVCQLGFVFRSALRLVRFYILEIYPPASGNDFKLTQRFIVTNILLTLGKSFNCSAKECSRIILTIDTIKQMFQSFLTDAILNSTSKYHEPLQQIASEIHTLFVACFHVFYPTPELKWNTLSELLDKTRKVIVTTHLSFAVLLIFTFIRFLETWKIVKSC